MGLIKVMQSQIFPSLDGTGVGCQNQGHSDDICPETQNVTLNDGAKIQPLLSSSTRCPNIQFSLTFHNDDNTFLTPGSCPACKTVTQEVALFVLTAHRTSGITGRGGALVWNIFKCEKNRDRQEQRIKCYGVCTSRM